MHSFLLTMFLIYLFSRIGGELAVRLKIPSLVGGILAGILLGLGGFGWIHPESETLKVFSEIGVMLLLFETGLESDMKGLFKVGWQAANVAVMGMLLPFLLGFLVMILTGAKSIESLFMAAALTATSIGITAKVLSELNVISSRMGQIIIGAAVLDDILGLLVLAIVNMVSVSGQPDLGLIALSLVKTLSFVGLGIWIGQKVLPKYLHLIPWLKVRGQLLTLVILTLLFLVLLAELSGTALIIGAFIAGLLFAQTDRQTEIRDLITPVSDFFTPFFFVSVGAMIQINLFNPMQPENWPLIGMGLILFLAALIGKILSGFFLKLPFTEALAIGIGMVPRGEVGLIFASIGLSRGVLPKCDYGVMVMVVLLTTLLAPILLRALLSRKTIA